MVDVEHIKALRLSSPTGPIMHLTFVDWGCSEQEDTLIIDRHDGLTTIAIWRMSGWLETQVLLIELVTRLPKRQIPLVVELLEAGRKAGHWNAFEVVK